MTAKDWEDFVVNAVGEWVLFIVGIVLCSFEHYGSGVIMIVLSLLSEAGRIRRLKREGRRA